MAVLKKLVSINLTARWYIKGDGTDLVKSLWQSGEWAGDVNLNDGKLQCLYSELQESLSWINRIGLNNSDVNHIKIWKKPTLFCLLIYVHFISSGKWDSTLKFCMPKQVAYQYYVFYILELQTANSKYEEVEKWLCCRKRVQFVMGH